MPYSAFFKCMKDSEIKNEIVRNLSNKHALSISELD
jgi:hypothetical protein